MPTATKDEQTAKSKDAAGKADKTTVVKKVVVKREKNPVKQALKALYWLIIIGVLIGLAFITFEAIWSVYKHTKV
jgi:hypothetical protein